MRTARYLRGLTLASVVAALGAAATMPACSVFYDLSADQCSIDADCRNFSGLPVCEAGVCVADAAAGGKGGSSTAGSAATGEAGEGGEAGAPPAPECVDNAECIDANFGQAFICQSGKCVSLTTKECPLVIGTQNLRALEPIVFGAYALAPDASSRSVVTRNLELVIDEFTNKVTGLRGGPGGSRRQLSIVVCNSSFPDSTPGTIEAFEPSLEHLIDTLHVPGIISALQAKDLQAVFSQKLDAAGTFVISPFEQDSELALLSDEGRLWNLLGATADIAPAFGPLLARTDEYWRSGVLFPNTQGKLRVALVTANIARETDVRDALLELPELAAFEVEPFQIESALVTASPDVSAVVGQLLDYAPHIIVALAGSEFIEGVFPGLEDGNTWYASNANQSRPLYVLGSTMAPQTWSLYELAGNEGGGWTSFFDRVVGVAYASAEDPALLDAYQLRLKEKNQELGDPSVLLGSETVYDAGYLMIYAAAAAGEVPALSGKDLAQGMRRLVDGLSYDVGPSAISNVLNTLDNDVDIGLNLTLGPPKWNLARGTRTGVGSVYCFNNNGFEGEAGYPGGPNNDVLRYDPTNNTLEDKPLRCIPDF